MHGRLLQRILMMMTRSVEGGAERRRHLAASHQNECEQGAQQQDTDTTGDEHIDPGVLNYGGGARPLLAELNKLYARLLAERAGRGQGRLADVRRETGLRIVARDGHNGAAWHEEGGKRGRRHGQDRVGRRTQLDTIPNAHSRRCCRRRHFGKGRAPEKVCCFVAPHTHTHAHTKFRGKY